MNIFKSLISVSLMTTLSRIFGFTRDVLIARIFGVGTETDVFFIVFKLSNLLRRIFAEGAFSQVFIPMLIDYRNKYNIEKIRSLISCVSGFLILILIIIVCFVIIFAPLVIMITVPGFVHEQEKFILSIKLLRITFPYILFISLSSMVSSILNIWNYFLIPAFAPILLNTSMICFVLLAPPLFYPPITALAWSVIIGGLFQIIFQLPFLRKINMFIIPSLNFKNVGLIRILRSIRPAMFSVSINQISLIINTICSSFLISGSVSWLYYADRLVEFPSGVLGVTFNTILLPLLSQSFSNKNYNQYLRFLDSGLRLCFILALPSTVILIILSKPLIITLFQYGKFSNFDTSMTQHALIAYSIGLLGSILTKVLSSGFYSRQDVKTPSHTFVVSLIITQLMNIIFLNLLKHTGLALSMGLSSCLNSVLLYWQLRRKYSFCHQSGWEKFFVHIFLGTVSMSVVLLLFLVFVSWIPGGIFYRLLRLFCAIIAGSGCFCITLWITGFKIRNFMSFN